MIECYARAVGSCLPAVGPGFGLYNASRNKKELMLANVYAIEPVQSAMARLRAMPNTSTEDQNTQLVAKIQAQQQFQVDLKKTSDGLKTRCGPILEQGLVYSIGGIFGNLSTVAATATFVNHRLPRISIFTTCGFITLKHGSDLYSNSKAIRALRF